LRAGRIAEVNRREQTARSVNRESVGRNKVNGIISSEIERVVGQPTFSLSGEGSIDESAMVRAYAMSPGFVPTACWQRSLCEQGRPGAFRMDAVGANKLARQGCIDDAPGVGLADITLRSGKPATWGSGQQRMNCSIETWAPFNGR